jgi:hypothetical protein
VRLVIVRPGRKVFLPLSLARVVGSDGQKVELFRLPPVKAAKELQSLRFKIGEMKEGRCPLYWGLILAKAKYRKRRGKGLSADAFTD